MPAAQDCVSSSPNGLFPGLGTALYMRLRGSPPRHPVTCAPEEETGSNLSDPLGHRCSTNMFYLILAKTKGVMCTTFSTKSVKCLLFQAPVMTGVLNTYVLVKVI